MAARLSSGYHLRTLRLTLDPAPRVDETPLRRASSMECGAIVQRLVEKVLTEDTAARYCWDQLPLTVVSIVEENSAPGGSIS
jgi:hypothetical protein